MTPSKLDEPPAWLAERNLSKSSAAGIEDGELYCQNVVAGTEKPEKPNHVRDCLAWYGNRIRQRGTLYCHQIVTGVEKPNNPKEPVTYVDDARQVWSILECMIHPDLLIIDPLQQFLGAGTNYGPIARAMMNDLTRCADKHQVAIIGVIHWAAYRNKIMGHEEIARIAPGSNATAGNRCEPGDVARFGGFPILGEVMCGMRLTIRVVVGCDGTVRAFGRRFPIRTRKQVVHVKR